MRRHATAAFACCAVLLIAGWPDSATAQVNCEAIPSGPDRTDCYIGMSRINREKAAIAASAAREQSDIAIYRSVTGTSANKKMRRTRPAR
jgi:hypothetical protein